ncbi:MAG: hypothetical protein K2J90_11645 [Lachnospiraceae bacterium]|nr:hypothetical protein [Lachnospiraceae bacterium]
MINEKYKILPYDVVEAGLNLEYIGRFEYAWKKDEIIIILKILGEKGIPVLGGDIYKIIDGRVESTYDSWFINNDGASDFVERSLDKAISYIEKYEHINGDEYVYALVF